MRNSIKIASALAVVGLAVTGGSAFTATSTIDEATKTVGATAQTISGVAVTDVSYDWDPANDETNAVTFNVGAALGADSDLTVTLNGAATTCAADDPDTYTCTLTTPIANVTSLSIVVN